MNKNRNNILVTGANGFIGSNLARQLACNQNNVIALIRPKYTHSNILDEGFGSAFYTLAHADINDYDALREIISRNEITHVFHCAAQSIVRKCANDPISAYETNVMGTVRLLEAIRQVGMPNIKSIVISTSDKALGHCEPPYTEESPYKPKYTYEATKSCQDIAALSYFHNYNLPIKVVRCSNVYGPGDPNQSRLIPNTIRRLSNNEKPLVYAGVANYKREFIYIDDVISAFNTVAHTGKEGEAYNIGGTGMINIVDLIKKIAILMDKPPDIEIIDKPNNFKEIEEQWINATKLISLGWHPSTTLDKGLLKTIKEYNPLIPLER